MERRKDSFRWYLAFSCGESEIKSSGGEHTSSFKSPFWGFVSRSLDFILECMVQSCPACFDNWRWGEKGKARAHMDPLMAGILPPYLGKAASLLMKICPASKDLCSFPSPKSTGQPDEGEEESLMSTTPRASHPGTHTSPSRGTGKWGCLPCTLQAATWMLFPFRWQQEGCWLQPPGDSAAVSCLQVQGNLPSHKKTNIKNLSHHFSSPCTMELSQPYGRHYFFLPRTVQKAWIFQWVEMQTFVWFFLYFNNRLQKMQGTSFLANVSSLHLSRTKDCWC